jgi:radical SAM protein with 4Fe4S-binding SPASM domain
MSFELFKKAIDQYHLMGGKNVGFSPTFGEVFLDPDFLNKVKYAGELGFDNCHTYTNATLLHRFGFDKILNSGLTALYLSLGPLNKEIYKSIFRNPFYDQVLENLSSLLMCFNELKTKTVKKIYLEFRTNMSFEETTSLDDYRRVVKPLLSKDVHVSSMRNYDSWVDAIKSSDLIEGMKIGGFGSGLNDKILPCIRSSILQVKPDGKVRACGCIYDVNSENDELLVGDLTKNTLSEIYKSEKMRSFKRSFYDRKLCKICQHCDIYSV